MLRDKSGKWSTAMFFIIVLVLPITGLLIMNNQLAEANRITGATAGAPAAGDTQVFAGALILLLVIGGLVSLFFKFHSKVKTKRKEKAENKNIDNLSEKIKKL